MSFTYRTVVENFPLLYAPNCVVTYSGTDEPKASAHKASLMFQILRQDDVFPCNQYLVRIIIMSADPRSIMVWSSIFSLRVKQVKANYGKKKLIWQVSSFRSVESFAGDPVSVWERVRTNQHRRKKQVSVMTESARLASRRITCKIFLL